MSFKVELPFTLEQIGSIKHRGWCSDATFQKLCSQAEWAITLHTAAFEHSLAEGVPNGKVGLLCEARERIKELEARNTLEMERTAGGVLVFQSRIRELENQISIYKKLLGHGTTDRNAYDNLKDRVTRQRRELRRLNKCLGPYWAGFRKGLAMEGEARLRGIMNAMFGAARVRSAEKTYLQEQEAKERKEQP